MCLHPGLDSDWVHSLTSWKKREAERTRPFLTKVVCEDYRRSRGCTLAPCGSVSGPSTTCTCRDPHRKTEIMSVQMFMRFCVCRESGEGRRKSCVHLESRSNSFLRPAFSIAPTFSSGVSGVAQKLLLASTPSYARNELSSLSLKTLLFSQQF